MLVDFHTHTHRSTDSRNTPAGLLRAALRRGLDAVAVCDHNSLAGARETVRAARDSGSAVRVIPGEEIRTSAGEIIGLFLAEEIEAGLSPEATVESIKAQGGLVCVPHPFDRYRSSPLDPRALERIADDVDIIEGLNARNLRAADDRKAQVWAGERGIPFVAGSDAHTYHEVGRVVTDLPWFEDAAGLRSALPRAVVSGRRSGIGVHLVTAVVKRARSPHT